MHIRPISLKFLEMSETFLANNWFSFKYKQMAQSERILQRASSSRQKSRLLVGRNSSFLLEHQRNDVTIVFHVGEKLLSTRAVARAFPRIRKIVLSTKGSSFDGLWRSCQQTHWPHKHAYFVSQFFENPALLLQLMHFSIAERVI